MSAALSSYPFDTVSTFRRGGKRKGHQLTLMVCGRSGLGKSTFINTLCDGSIYESELDSSKEIPQTMEITERTASFREPDGKLINLTVIDTPGFGTELICQEQIDEIRAHVEERFDKVLKEESRIDRSKFLPDTRIHCCLYFMSSTGNGLSELDTQTIAALTPIVNVIPVLAKSDTLTQSELLDQKIAIKESLTQKGIKLLDLDSEMEPDANNSRIEDIQAIRQMLPLAVSGSNSVYKIGEQYVRGREYSWGFSRSDDKSMSDLMSVREILFGDYLQDLKESTFGLYEKYRTKVLSKNTTSGSSVLSRSGFDSTTDSGTLSAISNRGESTLPESLSLHSVNV